MSMQPYEPDQYYYDDDDGESMQMRGSAGWQSGGSPGWQPGCRPPQRPPFGAPWPPGPGPGGWPFWGYWGFKLRSAWRDVKFLHKLLHDIIGEMVDDGLIAPGPNAPTTGPGSGAGTGGGTATGIKGVTDGSDAAPGQVGEFVTGSATVNFTASGQTVVATSPLVVQPGDWDLWAYMNVPPSNGASFQLVPKPTGISNDMYGWMVIGAAPVENFTLVGPSARGSFSIPTLLAFQVKVNGNGSAGTATLTVEARRRR